MARSAGIIALIAIGLFVVLARPVTRPTGRLNQPRGFTRWSLLAESGSDDHAPIEPPAGHAITLITFAIAGALPVLRRRIGDVLPVPPLRRRKIPPPRGSDSISSH